MSDNIVQFPKVHAFQSAEEALEGAKGWNFREVFIVGYVDAGSNEGTIIQTVSPNAQDTAKNQLFMAELLRFVAIKKLGLS